MSDNKTSVSTITKMEGINAFDDKNKNVLAVMEWRKWLSYLSRSEKESIAFLESEIKYLSNQELAELEKYRQQARIAKLLKAYGTSECSEDEYKEVHDFMKNESLEQLILSKLTLDELNSAKEAINQLSKQSSEQLGRMLEEYQKPEVYARLPIIDSYVVHMLSQIYFVKDINNPKNGINAKAKEK